jgi:hypothetical protein
MNSDKRPNSVGLGISEEDVIEMGYQYARQLEDGTWLAVARMFTNGRLYFNLDHHGAECCYCYKSVTQAVAAMMAFDPEWDEEPQGWFKDPVNNRIRPDGDASRETIGYPPPDENDKPKGKTK